MAKRRRLTEPQLMKLHKRMLFHATTQGNRHAEDVAQEYVTKLLSGLHQHATVGQAYIDIVRASGACSRSKYYQQQKNLEYGTNNVEALNLIQDVHDLTVDQKIDINTVLVMIKNKRIRNMMSMRFQGFTLDEIGAAHKVGESNVQQIISRTCKKLYKNYFRR